LGRVGGGYQGRAIEVEGAGGLGGCEFFPFGGEKVQAWAVGLPGEEEAVIADDARQGHRIVTAGEREEQVVVKLSEAAPAVFLGMLFDELAVLVEDTEGEENHHEAGAQEGGQEEEKPASRKMRRRNKGPDIGIVGRGEGPDVMGVSGGSKV